MENKWLCIYCNETFKTRKELFDHRKIHNLKNGTNSNIIFTCKYCGRTSHTRSGCSVHEKTCKNNPNWVHGYAFGRHYSDEVLNKSFKNNPNQGGLREGSGRGKKGWYKGFYCRSTWELAWLVYQLDANNVVKQCKESFEYTFNGEKHKYYPDFKIGETYYEIKGWHRPDVDAKMQQFPKDKEYVLIEGKKQIAEYLNYAKEKYGEDLTLLYEKVDNRGANESKFH